MRKRRRCGQVKPCDTWGEITGNLSRLIEPVVLYLLATEQARYGYELLEETAEFAITDAAIDAAAVYRTLRKLEDRSYVASQWSPGESGPSRRMYVLTAAGHEHLHRWAAVLNRRGRAMVYFSDLCNGL